jgi:beta-glucosidase
VRAEKVSESDVDDKVARLLTLARRVGALNGFVDGNGHGSTASPYAALIDSTLVRQAATSSFVLLKNERDLLPIKPGAVQLVALIGPNAVSPVIQGGGSIQVLPVTRPGIAEAVADALDARVTAHQGAITSATVALPPAGTIHDPVTGKPGVRLELHDAHGEILHDAPHSTSVLTWWDGLPGDVHLQAAQIVMRARYRAQVAGVHLVGAAGAGEMRVAVGDTIVAESRSSQPRDVVEALSRPSELRVPVQMHAGRDVDVRIEFRPEARFVTMRLGIAPRRDDAALIEEAVIAATAADVAVVIVGSAEGSESEGFDRPGMGLAGSQDELVRKVAAANPNTVVVLNTGMPVLMPWIDDVGAVLQAWLPGQEAGEALAEVLSGDAEPGGRLPISIPRAEADAPVYRAQPDNGTLAYSEGLLVGYRGYDRNGTDPLFAFGHGLGYTEWQYEALSAPGAIRPGDELEVTVRLRNAGARSGREVVEVYLEAPADDPARPLRTLAGFARVTAEPGETVEAMVKLRARAFACFDETAQTWVTPLGTYTVRVGRSSRDLRLQTTVLVG